MFRKQQYHYYSHSFDDIKYFSKNALFTTVQNDIGANCNIHTIPDSDITQIPEKTRLILVAMLTRVNISISLCFPILGFMEQNWQSPFRSNYNHCILSRHCRLRRVCTKFPSNYQNKTCFNSFIKLFQIYYALPYL